MYALRKAANLSAKKFTETYNAGKARKMTEPVTLRTYPHHYGYQPSAAISTLRKCSPPLPGITRKFSSYFRAAIEGVSDEAALKAVKPWAARASARSARA